MEKIGKYEIICTIGVGGFGVVYEGRDPFIKRRVAIKTCGSERGETRERFFREAEIAGNLHHRNIVTVHDFGIQDGVPYLVQEFLTGEDLKKKIARRDPLSDEQKLDYLLQIARGLEYAHSQRVIHRDIKPGNIRVLEDETVKIMDFGIAKLANVESNLTRTGITLGTAAYLAPEQIRGRGVDHRADIFSFGVLAYELLSYRRPFPAQSISALFFQILQAEPDPLSAHWQGCPRALESTLTRCLAKDSAARFASLREVLEELRAVHGELRAAARLSTRATAVLPREQILESADDLESEPEDEEVDLGACHELVAEAQGALDDGDLTAARRTLEEARGAYGETAVFAEMFAPLLDRLQEAESDRPEHSRAKALLAEAERRVPKELARRQIAEAVDRAARQVSDLVQTSRLQEAKKKLDAAQRALGESPVLEELRGQLDEGLRRRSFSKAARLVEARRFEDASVQLKRHLKDHPTDRRAWSLLQEAEVGIAGTSPEGEDGGHSREPGAERPANEQVGQQSSGPARPEEAETLEELLREEVGEAGGESPEAEDEEISAAYRSLETLLDLDDPRVARRHLEEAEHRYGPVPFLPLRGQLVRLERRLLDQELDRDVEGARQLLSEQRFAEAVEVLARILEVDPRHLGAQRVLEDTKEALAESLAGTEEDHSVSETARWVGSLLAQGDEQRGTARLSAGRGSAQADSPTGKGGGKEAPSVAAPSRRADTEPVAALRQTASSPASARSDNRVLIALLVAALLVLGTAFVLWLVG